MHTPKEGRCGTTGMFLDWGFGDGHLCRSHPVSSVRLPLSCHLPSTCSRLRNWEHDTRPLPQAWLMLHHID
jgi:hypothetical protein